MRRTALLAALVALVLAIAGCDGATTSSNHNSQITHKATTVDGIVHCAHNWRLESVTIKSAWTDTNSQKPVTKFKANQVNRHTISYTAVVDNLKQWGYVLIVTGCGTTRTMQTPLNIKQASTSWTCEFNNRPIAPDSMDCSKTKKKR